MLHVSLIALTLSAKSLWAQGSNTCSGAAAAQISLPFSALNQSTCGDGNDYNGNNACVPNSFGNNFGGADWIYAFTPNVNGYLSITLNDFQASGWVFPTIGLFDGCPGTPGACVAWGQGSTWLGSATLLQPVSAGTTYYIVVDAFTMSNFYASCFQFDINVSLSSITVQPSCTNMGFGSGNFSGWMGTTGLAVTGPTGALTPTYNATALAITNGRQTIMNGGNDPCGGFPRVDPAGGPFSVRLGNNNTGGEAEQLLQTFMVSPTNSSFTYRYAVVFEDPGHNSQEQPFFKALLRDQNGDIIPCSEFIVSAAANLPGFFNSASCSGVRFKPWSSVNVDLSNYLGQQVTVEFTAGDCSQGGHFGYAYIDAACAPSTLAALADTICPGESVTLTAPTGYQSYNWNPGNIAGQTITVSPTTSTTYTLNLVAFNGCTSQFQIPITVAPNPQVSFSWQAPACDLPVQLQSTSTVSSGSIASTNWNIPNGTPATASQSVVNVQFPGPGPGTYPVTLQVTSNAGCTAQVSQNVVVPPCEFRVAISGDTICAGQCLPLIPQMSYGIPPYTYLWSDGSTDSTRTVCPSTTTIYSLTVTDALGDVSTDTAQVTLSTGPVFQSTLQHPTCFGNTDGSINPNPVGYSPFSYQWLDGSNDPQLDNLPAGDYQLTVKDRFGCLRDTFFTLIEPDSLLFLALSTPSTCNLNNGVLEVISVSGGTPAYQYSLNALAAQTQEQFSNLLSGTYTLTVIDSLGCTAQQTLQVEALSFPTEIQFSLNPATCDSSNASIELAQVTGGMSPFVVALNGATPVTFNPNLSFESLTDSIYTLLVTDASGCTLDTSLMIPRIEGPSQLNLITAPATCGNSNASMNIDSVVGGSPGFLFSFNNLPPSAITQYTNLTPGSYPVTVSDANGCHYDTTITINALPNLTSTAVVVADVLCFGGNNASAELNITSGSAPFNILWSSGQATALADSLSAGQYTVQVSDSVGCTNEHTVVISQPDSLHFEINSINPVCNQSNGSLSVMNAQGGLEPYLFGLPGFPSNSSGTFSGLPDGSWTITITDAHQCSTSRNVLLVMPSIPTLMQLNHVDAVCSEANGQVLLQSVAGGVAPFTVNFNNTGDSTIAGFPVEFTQLPEGNYNINIRDANGCVIDSQQVILQFPGPSQMSLSTEAATCDLNNGELAVSATQGGTGPLSYSLNNGPFATNTSWNGLAPGAYTIAVRDSNGCLLDTLSTLAALENVSANAFVVQPVLCHNGSNGAAQANVISGYPPFEITWSNGDMGVQADSLSAGMYTVTVRDSNECLVSYSVEVSNPAPLQVWANGPEQVCEGDSIWLWANADGGTGHLDITWPDFSHSGDSLHVLPIESRHYRARVNDANGCASNDSVFVHLRQRPTGTVTATNQEGCSPLCIDFSVLFPPGDSIVSYNWNFGYAGIGNQVNQKICFTQSGNPEIEVEIRNQYGCTNRLDATGTVTVYPIPYADFSYTPDKPDVVEPRVQFYNESSDATQYRWAFGDGAISFEENPQHIYADTGNYTVCLRVSSGFGCSDTVCQPLKVAPFPTIYAPNVFTPNQDGKNERFKIVVTYATEFRLEIYDRWGELIHTSTNPDEGWDGTYKGRDVQSDVYVWKAYVTNALHKQHELIGRVSVIE